MNKESCLKAFSPLPAFTCAMCFVVGFMMIFYIEPGIHLNPHQRLDFILTNGRFFQAWYVVIFVVFGCSLLLLVNTINRIIAANQAWTYHLSMMFGFIWACYTIACGFIAILSIEYLLMLPSEEQRTVWFAIYSIQMGLGDGVEWVGGFWLLVLSIHGLQYHFPVRALHLFGAGVGSLGCLTLIPSLANAGALFGVLHIFWFIWVGILLYRASAKARITA